MRNILFELPKRTLVNFKVKKGLRFKTMMVYGHEAKYTILLNIREDICRITRVHYMNSYEITRCSDQDAEIWVQQFKNRKENNIKVYVQGINKVNTDNLMRYIGPTHNFKY